MNFRFLFSCARCLDGPAATSALRNLIRVLAGLGRRAFCHSSLFSFSDISNSRITDKDNEQVRLGGLRHPHLAGKATEFIESFLRKVILKFLLELIAVYSFDFD